MLVKDLIALLQTFDQEMVVMHADPQRGYTEPYLETHKTWVVKECEPFVRITPSYTPQRS